ncbi:hypothetical protein [Methylobacterium sp. P1-11]|uniref:hypothetical protein n=1 Tax=Methylobacterium sp. P1-11 TaxID=2024616 RepID=UPI0011EDA581|nr:hypothetical protein [Methylobacterium sp. P1-11]
MAAELMPLASYGNAAQAAEVVGTEADRRFLRAYSSIIQGYVDTLLSEHADPVDNHAMAAELSRAAADPFGTLKLHLAGKLEPRIAESVQAAIAESIDQNGQLGEDLAQIPQDVLSFMLSMQRAVEKEADRYRRPSSKRGPKKNFPIWMLTRDVFRLFEDNGLRTSLPSNANADDDESVTPLLRFAEIALSDAAYAAQAVAADHQDLDRRVRAALREAARKDAATPRRTLMMRLREYGRLRRGRNLRTLAGEIPAST